MSEPNVERAVIERLVGPTNAPSTPAGSRVYRELIENQPDLPVIVVTRMGGGPSVRVAGAPPAIWFANVRVEVIAVDLASLEAVATAIVAALDQFRGTVAGVTFLTTYLHETSEASSEVDGDQVLRLRQLDFRIRFR